MKSIFSVLLLMVSANGAQAPTPPPQSMVILTQAETDRVVQIIERQRVEIERLRKLCVPGASS